MPKILRRVAAVGCLIAVGSSSAAQAYQITTGCQKSLMDGRLLFSDGRVIPEGAETRIMGYNPSRTENGWTFGLCRVDIKKAAQR